MAYWTVIGTGFEGDVQGKTFGVTLDTDTGKWTVGGASVDKFFITVQVRRHSRERHAVGQSPSGGSGVLQGAQWKLCGGQHWYGPGVGEGCQFQLEAGQQIAPMQSAERPREVSTPAFRPPYCTHL